MNGRSIFLLFALSLSPMIAACGDDSTQKPSTYRLDGTYRPTEKGAIASVTFSNDKDYVLVPTGCDTSACVDRGTYRIDAAASTVTLENAVTHRERTITLDNVRTGGAGGLLVGSSLRTRNGELVSRQQETAKSGQQLNDGQQQLNDGQKQLIDQAQKLLETITEAAMNGQGMKQDDQGGQQNGGDQNGGQQNGQQDDQQDDQQQQNGQAQNDQEQNDQDDDQQP